MEPLRPLVAPLLLAAAGLVPLASGRDAQGLALCGDRKDVDKAAKGLALHT